MIVRARRKPIEEIPEKYLCCEANVRDIEQHPMIERRLDLSQQTSEQSQCDFCGRMVDGPFVAVVGEEFCVPFANYDLDEGVEDDRDS
ncbi:MAG TPA: hypothetical protein VN861_02870 [Candidatus Acidoferrales bacterium]|nr:hypothetical protein [Candidatus Acidoferrales bacterium]